MLGEFETRVETKDSVIIIHIIGELNIFRTSALLETVEKDIEAYKDVIIDLTKVTYMNSTAVGALLNFNKQKTHEIKLIIDKESHVNTIFSNLGIYDVFKTYETMEKALNG